MIHLYILILMYLQKFYQKCVLVLNGRYIISYVDNTTMSMTPLFESEL